MKTAFSVDNVAGLSGVAFLALSLVSQASLYVYPQSISLRKKLSLLPAANVSPDGFPLHFRQNETTWRAYFEGMSGDTLQLSEGDKKTDRTANVGIHIVYGAFIHVVSRHCHPGPEISQ